jgi:flavin-binding protein dodecin
VPTPVIEWTSASKDILLGYGVRKNSASGGKMSNRTYRITEIVGTSPDGIDQAIQNGIKRAGETLRHLDWFEVTEIRGNIRDGEIAHVQVGMKVGFRLEDA